MKLAKYCGRFDWKRLLKTSLSKSQKVLPYVFVFDDAFGLKTHMMKPFPSQNLPIDERIFNYRLSRARRVIENTFGLAASRFRIFRRPIIANVAKAKVVTKAVVTLHNFLMSRNFSNAHQYCPRNYIYHENATGFASGELRSNENDILGLQPLGRVESNNYSLDASSVRQGFRSTLSQRGQLNGNGNKSVEV